MTEFAPCRGFSINGNAAVGQDALWAWSQSRYWLTGDESKQLLKKSYPNRTVLDFPKLTLPKK